MAASFAASGRAATGFAASGLAATGFGVSGFAASVFGDSGFGVCSTNAKSRNLYPPENASIIFSTSAE